MEQNNTPMNIRPSRKKLVSIIEQYLENKIIDMFHVYQIFDMVSQYYTNSLPILLSITAVY